MEAATLRLVSRVLGLGLFLRRSRSLDPLIPADLCPNPSNSPPSHLTGDLRPQRGWGRRTQPSSMTFEGIRIPLAQFDSNRRRTRILKSKNK